MAINVYLALFKGYTIEQLRALDIRYLLGCYGLSFIPAFVFIFISTSRGPIYGPAVIWCWYGFIVEGTCQSSHLMCRRVSGGEWDFLRLIVLYAIVW